MGVDGSSPSGLTNKIKGLRLDAVFAKSTGDSLRTGNRFKRPANHGELLRPIADSADLLRGHTGHADIRAVMATSTPRPPARITTLREPFDIRTIPKKPPPPSVQ